jgi:hypothetical protein
MLIGRQIPNRPGLRRQLIGRPMISLRTVWLGGMPYPSSPGGNFLAPSSTGRVQKGCHRPPLRRANGCVVPTPVPPLDRPLGTSRGLFQRVSRQCHDVPVGPYMTREVFIAWTTVRIVHKSRRSSYDCGLKNGCLRGYIADDLRIAMALKNIWSLCPCS